MRAPSNHPTEASCWFWPGLAVGGAIMAFAVVGIVGNADDTNPIGLVAVLGGFLIVHDVVVAPMAIAVGWWVSRRVPAPAQGSVRAALALSALFVLVATPLVLGLGRRPTNNSTLPLDYGRNLVGLLVAVWAVAGIVTLRRLRRSARR